MQSCKMYQFRKLDIENMKNTNKLGIVCGGWIHINAAVIDFFTNQC